MNFIKEVIVTFAGKDKEEFEYFLARKKPQKNRKDVAVFRELYKEYISDDISNVYKGDQITMPLESGSQKSWQII